VVSAVKIFSYATAGVMLNSRAITFLLTVPIFLVSLTIHEYAHGWMAYRYGDDTAKRMGRLTLNPLAHISLLGTIILPLLVHFGWAKPVPVDFSVLTKSQIFKVAAAGPAANLLLALLLAIIFHLFRLAMIPPLGNFVLLAILFNIVLAVFNLIPVPPLDGSRMVYARLKSPRAIDVYSNFARFGMLILVGFLFLGGFELIVLPVVAVFYTLLGLPIPALTICPSNGCAARYGCVKRKTSDETSGATDKPKPPYLPGASSFLMATSASLGLKPLGPRSL